MTNDRASHPGWPLHGRYPAHLLSCRNQELSKEIPSWERCPGAAPLRSPGSHLLGWKRGEKKCPEPPDLGAGAWGPQPRQRAPSREDLKLLVLLVLLAGFLCSILWIRKIKEWSCWLSQQSSKGELSLAATALFVKGKSALRAPGEPWKGQAG